MLTKDLLKYRVRSGVVKPGLVKLDDEELTAFLQALVAPLPSCAGKRLNELELLWEGEGLADYPLYGGFKKLVADHLQFAEVAATIGEQRWQWVLAAQALRREQLFTSKEAFHEAFAAAVGEPYPRLAEALYEDLPEYRRITAAPPLTPEELIARYNCAQVQGLLVRARSIVCELPGASLKERRDFFRAIKFHRLVAEVAPSMAQEEGALRVEITGPLALFQQTQTYGMRLANFFPRLLLLKKWQLTAELSLSERSGSCRLELAPSKGLVSPYQEARSYVPEELALLITAFNAAATDGWQAQAGEDFLHLGRQSYCFPDLSLISPKGEKFYMELFHKWHYGQLKDRLETLQIKPFPNLIIGVCRTVAKKDQIAAILKQSSWFARQGLIFGDFPTPKAILTVSRQLLQV